MSEFSGFLFSKLQNIGARAEGPAYFLQLFNYREVLIEKQVDTWEPDIMLQKFLGMKVKITGEIIEDVLRYRDIALTNQI